MTRKVQWYLVGLATIIAVVLLSIVLHTHRDKTSNLAAISDMSSAVSTSQVAISDYMFMPMTIKVKVGTTVTWTNEDQAHHSVTADKAASYAPDGPLIDKGQTYDFTFTKTGTYTFHCMPHPYMHGTVVVTD